MAKHGHKWTEEQKRKFSESLKEKYANGELKIRGCSANSFLGGAPLTRKQITERANAKYFQIHGEPRWKKYNAAGGGGRKWYRTKYGISLEEFQAKIIAQNGLCPIGLHPFSARGKSKASPCMDHCHVSGSNRDVLCREHNIGLGNFHDSIPELEAAIAYLKKFKKES